MRFCLETWCSVTLLTVKYIATFCGNISKNPMSVRRLRLLFLSRPEILRAVFARAQRRSSSTASLLLY